MNSLYENLMQYSLGLALKKRYTIAEMERKLKKRVRESFNNSEEVKINSEADSRQEAEEFEKSQFAVGEVIERLCELAYLDDAQYCRDYINDRIKFKPRGINMIRHELLNKGLEKKLVEGALSKIEIDELAMGKTLLSKRALNWTDEPMFKQKQKAIRFLMGKGFSRDSIYKLVESCYSRS